MITNKRNPLSVKTAFAVMICLAGAATLTGCGSGGGPIPSGSSTPNGALLAGNWLLSGSMPQTPEIRLNGNVSA